MSAHKCHWFVHACSEGYVRDKKGHISSDNSIRVFRVMCMYSAPSRRGPVLNQLDVCGSAPTYPII